MITLDGSHLEGGGQIVRTALALSVLTQKAFHVTNIRAKRPTPGLKNQHLLAIRTLRDLCGGVAEGAVLGSTALTFYPRPITKRRDIEIDVGTAGSLTLLMQALLLPAMFCGKRIKITMKGGTDVAWSPSYDYFRNVVLPQFLRYGKIECSLQQRGYYPKGQGVIELICRKQYVFGDEVKPLSLMEQGTLIKISGLSHASSDLASAQVAERQATAARALLGKWKIPVDIVSSSSTTSSTGSGITLWAIFARDHQNVDFIDPIRVGVDVLGEKGKKAELVGQECAEQLNKTIASHAPIDTHLADHLIPLLGIVGGEITVQEISNHTKTNIHIVEQFLDVSFHVDETLGIVRIK
jgi:RNA 3'-terminal phosphate cyclase (GTP)